MPGRDGICLVVDRMFVQLVESLYSNQIKSSLLSHTHLYVQFITSYVTEEIL